MYVYCTYYKITGIRLMLMHCIILDIYNMHFFWSMQFYRMGLTAANIITYD